MNQDIKLFIDILTPLIIIIGTLVIWSFRTTAERIQNTQDSLIKDVNEIQVDVATLKEWRNNQDEKHRETLAVINALKKTIEDKLTSYDNKISRLFQEYDLRPKRNYFQRRDDER